MSIDSRAAAAPSSEERDKAHKRILDAFRRWGYLQADLDPLGRLAPAPVAELDSIGEQGAFARRVYCGPIGAEFMHIADADKRRWLHEQLEREPPDVDARRILERLIASEVFEDVLHARYPGTKRFSLEGAIAVIPLLDEVLTSSAASGAVEIMLGMSHRGRLNVILHIVGKDPADIFAGFEDTDPRSVLGGGDVKYHLGASGTYHARNGASLTVQLVSNPSHLEAVYPVVLGRARARQMQQRSQMAAGTRPIDFGMSEALSFATLLEDGVPVRLSGQDSVRGTFSHRHAVLVDIVDERRYCPLAHTAANGATFEVYNSPLSEAAVLGFEYGYSRDYPEALVLWEAQFGDFANNAQVIIDQFIASAEDKWRHLSGLTLLLPHGYEGQRPEHSSARVERFLQVAAEENVQICQPSTAVQYFHVLRRQALTVWRIPLVIFTPKSLLRHSASSSSRSEFAEKRFKRVLQDHEVADARRVLLCTGKIGHELRAERARRGDDQTAIVSVEQLAPFPSRELAAEFVRYPNAKDFVWVQEEPANMGARAFMMPRLRRLLGGRPLRSVRRSASASPATGSAKAHDIEQRTLLAMAFGT